MGNIFYRRIGSYQSDPGSHLIKSWISFDSIAKKLSGGNQRSNIDHRWSIVAFQSFHSAIGCQHSENGPRNAKFGRDPVRTRDDLSCHADVFGRSHGTLGCQGWTRRDVSMRGELAGIRVSPATPASSDSRGISVNGTDASETHPIAIRSQTPVEIWQIYWQLGARHAQNTVTDCQLTRSRNLRNENMRKISLRNYDISKNTDRSWHFLFYGFILNYNWYN